MKLKCIVVDDEPLAVEKMSAYIARVPFLELQASFTSGMDALQYLKDNSTDLLFLDIQMDDLTGIQLLEVLKNKPQVVFTTAYSDYALKGYELEVSDYLLKPISFERFLQSANRAYDKMSDKTKSEVKNEQLAANNPPSPDFMFVKTEYRMEKVKFNDIHYVEGMKDYLRIVCPEKRIMTLTNFKNMLDMLPEEAFCRIHKSYIINLSKIQSIEKSHVVVLNERLPIGDSFRKSFFELLEKLRLINNK
ncbi:MAG: LytR/AlgR family response regulator transcription factor [Bacteroidales bacterium]|jgi:DNA-binding LytR/AlgR family response regulator|nr:LytTR family DNA-binding domain-containing protein [Bacteroidales bacterium]HPF01471.1 LytTR family DNA-binding domain-containing protein [Bacteroidales bacterium]